MNWHEQRKIWNQAGQCSRQACRGPLHHSDGTPRHGIQQNTLKYCLPCVKLITDANPGPSLFTFPEE